MAEVNNMLPQDPELSLVRTANTNKDALAKSIIDTKLTNAVDQGRRAGEEMEAARVRQSVAHVKELLFKQMKLYCEHFGIKETDLNIF
jgi:flavoprotein